MKFARKFALLMAGAALGFTAPPASTQETPFFDLIQVGPNHEITIELLAPSGHLVQIQASIDLKIWDALFTSESDGNIRYTDSSSRFNPSRYYRAIEVQDDEILTGDHLPTPDGDIIIHPVNHASFVLKWKDQMIYNDPVGGANLYDSFQDPTLILVSHTHGDHFNSSTLSGVMEVGTRILAPQEVFNRMSTGLQNVTTVLANGETSEMNGIHIEAVPAYNDRHAQGLGNGYIVTIAGKRLYMSGDTGDIVEMRALKNIDIAFLSMNLPFTMSVTQAASAVRDFQPGIVYPYHYRNQDGTFADFDLFREQIGQDPQVEIRIRDWY